MQGHRTNESLHEEFAGERENYNVEGHESEVFGPFAIEGCISIVSGVVGDEMVVGRQSVGQKEGIVKRIRRARIYGISGEDDDHDNERVDPCVPEREGFPSPQYRLCFPPFGRRTGAFRLRIALIKKVSPFTKVSATGGSILVSKEEK